VDLVAALESVKRCRIFGSDEDDALRPRIGLPVIGWMHMLSTALLRRRLESEHAIVHRRLCNPWIRCVAVLAAGPRSACGKWMTIRSFFKLRLKLAMVTKSSAANKWKVSSCRDGSFQDPWMHQLTARGKCGSPWHTKCVTSAWQTS